MIIRTVVKAAPTNNWKKQIFSRLYKALQDMETAKMYYELLYSFSSSHELNLYPR